MLTLFTESGIKVGVCLIIIAFAESLAIFALLLVTLTSCTAEEIQTYSNENNTQNSLESKSDIDTIIMPLKPR